MSVQGYCSSGLPGPGGQPGELHVVHGGGAAGCRRTCAPAALARGTPADRAAGAA